jgi:hypothetical protein
MGGLNHFLKYCRPEFVGIPPIPLENIRTAGPSTSLRSAQDDRGTEVYSKRENSLKNSSNLFIRLADWIDPEQLLPNRQVVNEFQLRPICYQYASAVRDNRADPMTSVKNACSCEQAAWRLKVLQ